MKQKNLVIPSPHLLIMSPPDNGEFSFDQEEVLIWAQNPDLGRIAFYCTHNGSSKDLKLALKLSIEAGCSLGKDKLVKFEMTSLPPKELANLFYDDIFENVDENNRVDTAILLYNQGFDLINFFVSFSEKSSPVAGPLFLMMSIKSQNSKAKGLLPSEMFFGYTRNEDKKLDLPTSIEYVLYRIEIPELILPIQ